MNKKILYALGWTATILTAAMYFSYFIQIQKNLAGDKGPIIQPLIACISCICWVIYAIFKPGRDIPLFIACVPGVILGFLAFYTAL